jgi:hypothetical protein
MRIEIFRLASLSALLVGPASFGQSLSLSPSVVEMSGRVGQSATQTLRLTNKTSQSMDFDLQAQDVVVKDGARTHVAAGQLKGSIAATAVFTPREVTVPPGETRQVSVTVTLPYGAEHRAIVALFKGKTMIRTGPMPATASLGTLITFALPGEASLSSSDLSVLPQSSTRNVGLEQQLFNDGTEPVVPSGAAVILGAEGKMVGKLQFESRRLLPGEKIKLHAEYAGELRPGHYRVLSTFAYAGKSITRSASLDIP